MGEGVIGIILCFLLLFIQIYGIIPHENERGIQHHGNGRKVYAPVWERYPRRCFRSSWTKSRELGHVPVIDVNRRRADGARQMTELEKEIYKDRSAAERLFSHLLDAHGGRNVRVRAPEKVMLHLLPRVIVIAVEQTIRMLC